MPEEKNYEHQKYNSHEKKDEKYKFEIAKVRVWQLISVIMAIAIVFLWFNSGFNKGSDATGAVVQTQQPQAQAGPTSPFQEPQRINVDAGSSPFLGPKNAKVTVVEFSDFECPYCGAAMGTHQSLVQRFKAQDPSWEAAVPNLKELAKQGKIRLVFKQFPLEFHKQSKPAAEASMCASEQGKFWEFHDALFENQEKLGKDLYIELAGKLGLSKEKFTQCIDSNKYNEKVQNDLDYGKQIGVSGTPTFFINGIGLVGAQPYSAFRQIIDEELASK